MNQYLLTIRVPFEAVDNLDARIKYRLIMGDINDIKDQCGENTEIKLQQVFKGEPPKGVEL